MHLKSILNRVEPHKSFVYTHAIFVGGDGAEPWIEVQIEPRANGRAICSGCVSFGASKPATHRRLKTGHRVGGTGWKNPLNRTFLQG
jgi:uncharacterized protein YndB with AHSA1/START domain